jgi:hypothetical protein
MEIAEFLSSQRLGAFRRSPQEHQEELLRRYLWNIVLSEALYPALHLLEVALRNHVHEVIAKGTRDPNWLMNARGLSPHEVMQVNRAIDALNKQEKAPDIGKVIAELSFGFWTSFFDTRYERVFWQRSIKLLFPDMPRKIRTRQTVSARLNRIRRLRNRVFHYEPIWHWKDLSEQHQAICETIGWMSENAVKLLNTIDRFSGVLANDPDHQAVGNVDIVK